MRKKISKKQIGAVGMAAMMAVQTPAMAVETTKETPAQETTQETSVETSTEGVEVEETEASTEGIQTVEVSTEEMQAAEEVVTEAAEEVQETTEETQETMLSTEPVEIENVSEPAEVETEADIVALAAEEDGWHENSDGSRYYVKNGEILKNCVEKIDGAYYGFNSNGIMYSDTKFEIRNTETQENDYYYAKKDGTLFVNEWDIWNAPGGHFKSYYGEDGKRYTGLRTIGEKQYYFDNEGENYRSTVVTNKDGKKYFCDCEGVAVEFIDNGWIEVDGNRYYIKNEIALCSCTEKIGNSYYGFGYLGILYVNCRFEIWNSEIGKYDYYRSKEDASLYVSEWYDDANGTYYYDEGGKESVGLQTIDGKQYYFDKDGTLCKNTIVLADDGTQYSCDADGIATELGSVNNDWIELNGNRYYVKDGKIVKSCVEKIGNFYYGFDENGNLYVDKDFHFLDQENHEWGYYRAKADGSLYVNEWYEINEYSKYYYGADGKHYTGCHVINGKLYCFREWGEVYLNNAITTEDGKNYYCDANGIATELPENGWNEIGEKRFYVRDGKVLRWCITEINGIYYGFGRDGSIYLNQEFIYGDSPLTACDYRAKADGSLYINEWYIESSNSKYYYGADGKQYSGLQTIEDRLYYFDENGRLSQNTVVKADDGNNYYCDADGVATELGSVNNEWIELDGKRYYIKNGEIVKHSVIEIDGTYYGFDRDGNVYTNTEFEYGESPSSGSYYYRAKEDGSLYVNEWYQPSEPGPGSNSKYYYGEGGIRYTGLHTIEGKQYYFSEWGWLYTNKNVTAEDGKHYYCDSDGVATELPENGWVEISGDRFYVKDGEILKGCIEKIGDSYYAFNWDGGLYPEGVFTIWNSETAEFDNCCAKADGSLYVNEWYIYDEANKKYYGADTKEYIGLHTIEGNQYYFDEWGWLCRNQMIKAEDGKNYHCDADGIATELPENGWTEIDGNRFYIKDGEILKDCVEKIGDSYYGFNGYGGLYSEGKFTIWNSETAESDYYRAKEDGSLYVNEWYDNGYDKFYYGADAKQYFGLHTIDGKQYYFASGYLRRNTIVTVEDGKNYYCDADGVATELLNNRWTLINGKYYYVKDSQLLKNCVEKIGNSYYGFNYDGIMYSDCEFNFFNAETQKNDYYRAKEDGSLYVNEWYGDSTKYYYGADAKAYTGLQTVDGKQYYFNQDGRVGVNCAFSEDGKNYYCDEDGALSELPNNQWTKVGIGEYSTYVYVRDGELLKNCVAKINGVYYGFGADGYMGRDTDFFFWNEETQSKDYYHASADGSLYTNRWGANCYYGPDAKCYKGIQTIDGIQYGFTEYGSIVKSNFITADGSMYYCDVEGRVVDKLSDNQWYYSEDGYWYYVQDGELVKDCSIEINGKQYRFDWNGKMQTQGVDINEDGSLRVNTNTWIHTGSSWQYYGEDGQPYTNGIYEIAGVKYHFSDGYMSTSKIVSEDNIYYVADENGYLTQIPDTGWILIGSDYYYAQNGAIVTSNIRKINGAYYAFDYNGKMYADEEFERNSATCRARADGSLYVSQWYQDVDGSWYYYDQNAAGVKNSKFEINGVTYLFDSTRAMKTNGVIQVGEEYYLADENGIWVQTPGWVLKGGCYYYVKADGSLCTGLLEDNNEYYYLNPVMETNVELKSIDDILYNIGADGHLVMVPDGFYNKAETMWIDLVGKVVDRLYYVSDGKTPEKGWKVIDGSWYYFDDLDSNGMCRPVVDSTYKIDGKYYLFNADGTMVSNGWKLVGETWYYAFASGELATGDVTVNGTLYHFNKQGVMQEETEKKTGIVVEDGICKLYSEDGSLLETGNGQGWNLLGGDYYYQEGDSILKSGSYKLSDGNWYGFDYQGRMLVNVFYEDDSSNSYWYGESGAAQTGWFLLAGNLYYASTTNGTLYKGLHTINGVKYYFDNDGIMQTKSVVVSDYPGYRLIMISDSGAVTDIKSMEDGWSCYDGEWYYYQNRNPYTGWLGDYYIENGRMCRNTTMPYISLGGTKYYLGEDGVRQRNKWCGNGKYYAKADGTLARNEWLNIDGTLHYFNSYSEKSAEKITDDGIFTKDGQYFAAKAYAPGWVLIYGNYYYKEGEKFIKSQAKKINGDWYLFDERGKMVTGFAIPENMPNFWNASIEYDGGYYYYGKDGRRQSYTGWQVIDQKWYYFDEYSRAATGWQTINGVKYYFGTTTKIMNYYGDVDFIGNPDHFMYTGYWVIGGEFYYFDASGACQGIDRNYTGWHLDDSGNWYYIRNGHAVTGTTVIDGVLYEFDGYGVWNIKS